MPATNGSCLRCPDECLTCDYNQKCTVCNKDYFLNSMINECEDNSITGFPKRWPIWGIFMACTFGIGLIFVLI
jgi:hypothetical protein